MEPLSRAELGPLSPIVGESDRRLRAFRALDAFALEAYQAARLVRQQDGDALAGEIGRTLARAGGALVSACGYDAGSPAERNSLETAHARLLEGRYPIYLARRLGFFDVRRYRALATRHETALREIESLLRGGEGRDGRRPP